MDMNRVRAVLESPANEAIQALLDDEATVFWVDCGEEDETIADGCEEVLRTGRLSGEYVATNTAQGYAVYIRYGGRRVRVPLTGSAADRHVTLCTLNEALAPDYEVRFCLDSNGSSALAFLPLSAA
jgi:hypothetical protein